MNQKKCLLFLSLLVYLCVAHSGSSRDLSHLTKPLTEQSSVNISDTVPDHLINWPLYNGVHQTGQIEAVFNCFGTFGRAFSHVAFDYTPALGAGSFKTPTPTGSEHLFGGAVWVGGIVDGDTLVSVGADGWQAVYELFPPNFGNNAKKGTVNIVDYIANQSYRTEFADTVEPPRIFNDPFDGYHRPLNIKVANRSFSWQSSPHNKTIIYDLVITNVGNKDISDGYCGLFFDSDVGNVPSAHDDDLSGSLKEHGIGYTIDNDGDFVYNPGNPADRAFAFKFLSSSFEAIDTNYNWWLSNGDPTRDFGPRQRGTSENPFRDFGTGGIGTPEGDANKYYMMSNDEWDYDQIFTGIIGDTSSVWLAPNPSIAPAYSQGHDTKFMMSIGPFDLKPDSSVRVLFATFTGESIFSAPGAEAFLPEYPDSFLSLLNFDDLIGTADASDELAILLMDPLLPPLGLQLIIDSLGTPELQWDAWAFDDVIGYDLFIEEADLSQLPKPGAIPPWWNTTITEPTVSLPPTHRLDISNIDPNTYYLAQIAHVHSSGRGELSTSLTIKLNPRAAAPQTSSNYALATAGQPIILKWESPVKSSIDHYNIYKFADSAEAAAAYHIAYDQGYQSQFIPVNDSFIVDGKTYYYYAMEPYAVVPPGDTEFIDPTVIDGGAYIIASADEYGFESEFTDPIVSYVVPEMDRDILLLTKGFMLTIQNYTYLDSILSFYNTLLSGKDYEIYKVRDSLPMPLRQCISIECVDWRPLMRFKLIIIDDYLMEVMLQPRSKRLDIFSRYLAYGGKIVYFGRFYKSFRGMAIIEGQPQYDSEPIDFFGDIFGIKQMFTSGPGSYTSQSFVDSLFGFTRAQQVSGFLPSLDLDTSRDPFNTRLRNLWPMATPPGVATFIPEEGVTTTHLFKSIHPNTSIQQEHIVGIRKDWPEFNTQTYTFGFHLWYMDMNDARELLEAVLSSSDLLASKTTIGKEQYRVLASFSAEPSFADLYIGNIEQNIDVTSIDENSILINSSTSPSSVEILSSHPDFVGQVIKLKIPLKKFFSPYTPVWDTIVAVYSITANLIDDRSVKTLGSFTLIGRLRRDINNDGKVDVTDLTLLVDFLFRGGELPKPLEESDINSDGSVNILDLTGLIDYIFRGKAL